MLIIYCWAIVAKEISDLWMEYEENSTLEAKVVKDFDKVLFMLPKFDISHLYGVYRVCFILFCIG